LAYFTLNIIGNNVFSLSDRLSDSLRNRGLSFRFLRLFSLDLAVGRESDVHDKGLWGFGGFGFVG
jgi:hypothetical protein